MLSRDPRKYNIKIQFNFFKTYDDEGFVEDGMEGPYKTFWLESVDGKFSRRYSTESAPEWVMQIFNKHIPNEYKH
jgi:hypothetical protein